LRHPAIVARQLATIALLSPGRFTFGVGVGGDDPKELELCGIDPRARGARTTEALRCVRLLRRPLGARAPALGGFGASRAQGRKRVSAAMQAAYALPFERFERYVPYGPPEAVAEALSPYLAVGCRRFKFVPEADGLEAAVEAVAEVKALLAADPV
jgi:hypothetical protein